VGAAEHPRDHTAERALTVGRAATLGGVAAVEKASMAAGVTVMRAIAPSGIASALGEPGMKTTSARRVDRGRSGNSWRTSPCPARIRSSSRRT
jgi:hypothetical protein